MIGSPHSAGARQQLIYAAIGTDRAIALKSIRNWLAAHDLDDVGFSEHRLLAAVVERFGSELTDAAEFPRLTGLQRLNWTKSRMAIREVLPALEAMVEAEIKVVLIKGAARVAQNPNEQKSRTSYDVDILVQDQDFNAAVGILFNQGWQSNRGESRKAIEARIDSIRNRNFVKGKFGDIDLHRLAYQNSFKNGAADDALFAETAQVAYFGVPAFVPSPEERLAMAIAHGVRDVGDDTSHSDWLIDAARILESEDISWDRFVKIAKRRRMRPYALGVLSYLHSEFGCDLPNGELSDVRGRGLAGKCRTILGWVSCRRNADLGIFARLLRDIDRVRRELSSLQRRRGNESARVIGFFLPWRAKVKQGLKGNSFPLTVPQTGRYRFKLLLEVDLPPAGRRVEFEINSPNRNYCNLFTLSLSKTKRTRYVSFRGAIEMQPGDDFLEIEARAGRVIFGNEPKEYLAKYDATPFRVVVWKFRQID